MKLIKTVSSISILFIVFCMSCNVDDMATVDFTVNLDDPQYFDLSLTGGYVYVDNIIILRALDQNYYALSRYCTYDGSDVQYQVAYDQLVCPSDQSHWNVYGNVMLGPAQQPLYAYMTSLNGRYLRVFSN